MKRLLVIDDDIVSREVFFEILKSEEYHVVMAENGKQGLAIHREEPCDLVITDIIMPEMEGLETIRELKRISPNLKLIAISGGGRISSGNYLELAEKMGAHLTFNKPIVKEDILHAIRALLCIDD